MKDNLLGISWHDSAWIPVLNSGNVIDYFSERSNPFYDRTCNNEIVKMQRLSPDQLMNMTGLEYILLHVQEPILYVIRKQHRHSATQATPISDYYIIAGVVYQAPDLSSVVNSRLLSTINHMQSAFDEILSYSRYHPSKGYTWEFKEKDVASKLEKKKEKKEEPSSLFQRQRVDMLLVELSKKFPLRTYVPQSQIQGQPDTPASNKPATPAGNEDSSKPDSNNPGGGGTNNAVIKTEPQDIKPNMQQLQQQQNQDKSDSFGNSGSGNAMPNNTNNLQQPTQNQQRMKPPPEKRARMS